MLINVATPELPDVAFTIPDIDNWANLTKEERKLLGELDRNAHPFKAPGAQETFNARYNACEAILKPYVESLGQFKILKAHKHAIRDSKTDWVHERLVERLVRAMCTGLQIYAAPVVHHLIAQHKAGETLKLRSGDVLRCYSCGATSHIIEMKGNTLTPFQYDRVTRPRSFKHLELDTCPIDPKLPYSAEIDIPSGKMVMANHLSPLFKEIEDKHSEEKSINYLWGRKNCTLEYAKQGYIEMNVGNGSCCMYQTNREGSKFIIGESSCVRGRKEVASVCTDFWGYGIADLDLAMTNGLEAMQKANPCSRFDIVPCKPGRYRFTHRYHLCGRDGNEIFTHIERIGDVS